MNMDVDTKQRLQTAATFLLEFFKISMASFLTVFVPRDCGDGVCSIADNLNEVGPLHSLSISTNSAAFLAFLVFYAIELERENFCIEFLDINEEKPIDHLDDEIENYPSIKSDMRTFNERYRKVTVACAVVHATNVCVSIIDLTWNWAGAASLTPLLSYTILATMKVVGALDVSKKAIMDEKALSAYLKSPVVYNDIDEDHRSEEN